MITEQTTIKEELPIKKVIKYKSNLRDRIVWRVAQFVLSFGTKYYKTSLKAIYTVGLTEALKNDIVIEETKHGWKTKTVKREVKLIDEGN